MSEHDATETGHRTRGRVGGAGDRTGTGASEAASPVGGLIDQNPLALLAGGVAVGAIAALVIPASARERQALSGVGQRINAAATAATRASREAGLAELEDQGLTIDAAREQTRTMFQGVLQALSRAGEAAAKAAMQPRD